MIILSRIFFSRKTITIKFSTLLNFKKTFLILLHENQKLIKQKFNKNTLYLSTNSQLTSFISVRFLLKPYNLLI